MGLRPGRCYRSKKDRAYTRVAVTVPKKNYIGAVPGLKTRQFNMGNGVREFDTILDLIVEDAVQIRDNAFESVRISINRYLNNAIGKDAYFMKIRVYPHQILRENKMAQGAGADRISQGMSQSFGKPIGKAVRTRKGQKIMSVLVNEEHIEIAQKALGRASARLPSKIRIRIGKDVETIGTRPRKTRDVLAEEQAAADEAKKVEEAAKAEAEGKEKGKEAEKPEGEKKEEVKPEEKDSKEKKE